MPNSKKAQFFDFMSSSCAHNLRLNNANAKPFEKKVDH